MVFLKKIPLVIVIILATVLKLKGQPLISPPGVSVHNQVFISVSLEPELVTTVGYTHLIGHTEKDLDFHIGTGLKFAPLILENKAFRFNLTGIMDWAMTKNWKTRFSTGFYLVHDNNRAAVMNGLGVDLRSSTLHFGDKWTKGFEFGWQYTGLTNIRHSAESKDTFNERYPNDTGINGPKGGWYKATASRFRLGFVTSLELGDQWGLQFAAGTQIAVQKQGILLGFSHAQVPVYLSTAISYQY